ncbi:MAG: L,D-transpeptidase [Myxococcota bacterium]
MPLPPDPATPLPRRGDLAPALPCLRVTQIEVSKSERRLRARCEGGAVVEMTAALGREPFGPKRDAGDWRTPEGSYRISEPPRSSRFHVFIPIDYPSPEDAEAALEKGRISERVYQRIVAAHARSEPPPDDTALGGGLGFHGEGKRWRGDSVDLDWTYGCVGLADADIDFLAERIEVGTPVEILP